MRSCVQDIAWKPHVCCQGAKIRTIIIMVDDNDGKKSEDFNSADIVDGVAIVMLTTRLGKQVYCKEAP